MRQDSGYQSGQNTEHSVTVSSDIKQCFPRMMFRVRSQTHESYICRYILFLKGHKIKHRLTGELRCPLEACWLVRGEGRGLVSHGALEAWILRARVIQVTRGTDTRVVKA